jgi:Uma2 family endonuclease
MDNSDMASTTVLVPRKVYLESSYSPDRDWVDGELKERKLGEFEHANLQGTLTTLITNRRREWKVRALPEQRIQVSANRYRVPDITVIPLEAGRPAILTEPPLACIEILSPDETVSELRERCKDYQQMGVPFIWSFDPLDRKAWTMEADGSWKAAQAELKAGSIVLSVKEVFEASAE